MAIISLVFELRLFVKPRFPCAFSEGNTYRKRAFLLFIHKEGLEDIKAQECSQVGEKNQVKMKLLIGDRGKRQLGTE